MARTKPEDMTEGTVHQTSSCGSIEILDYVRNDEILVCFKETGTKLIVAAKELRNGQIKDRNYPTVLGIGFLGYGKYKTYIKGKHTAAYSVWYNMLSRCYGEWETKNTYKGCTVCEEWLNYQNFAEWFYTNRVKGYDLDKDLVSEGNKLYSPKTCTFLPQDINKKCINKDFRSNYRDNT